MVAGESNWRLNERHYGALQGLEKADTVAKYGLEQVHIWRRSYDIRPPALTMTTIDTPARKRAMLDLTRRRYRSLSVSRTRSERFLPYWQQIIMPEIKSGKHVIITAHGNSLRALVKHLGNVSNRDMSALTFRPVSPWCMNWKMI